MLLTGMRRGELENLTSQDVHFELSIIFIQAKEGWNPKSGERIIPISQYLLAYCQEFFSPKLLTCYVSVRIQNGEFLPHHCASCRVIRLGQEALSLNPGAIIRSERN
jgi:hypothetical protein